jgi:hypothetical protein
MFGEASTQIWVASFAVTSGKGSSRIKIQLQTVTSEQLQSVASTQTVLVYTTWLEMYGSGVLTGIARTITTSVREGIQEGRITALTRQSRLSLSVFNAAGHFCAVMRFAAVISRPVVEKET